MNNSRNNVGKVDFSSIVSMSSNITIKEAILKLVYYKLCVRKVNQSQAARQLGISRGTLRKYMKLGNYNENK
jgi:DNA-binding protein Fis